MSIIQISKIQQRSGELVDLPQLDEAEFGFATDQRRLFIGKTVGEIQNIEVLTSYSAISFSQIDGAIGNLDLNPATISNGQLLVYDGNNWINRGGEAGGLITLGDASNVKITGGAIGYVLETDGTGNVSWQPKNTILCLIENVTIGFDANANANTFIVTTTEDNVLTTQAEVTITNVPRSNIANTIGNALSGNTFYIKVLTGNTFSLFNDLDLEEVPNTSNLAPFPYTTATNVNLISQITVGNASQFAENDPVLFVGNLAGTTLEENTTYYIDSIESGNTIITLKDSEGAAVILNSGNIDANVYVSGGRITSLTSSGPGTIAGGSNTSIQFNRNNILDGTANFTFNNDNNHFNLIGTATITGNATLANVSANRLTVTNLSNLGNAGNVIINGGTSGQFLQTNGSGNLSWATVSANTIFNGNSNVSIPTANGNVNISVSGNANVVQITGAGININGLSNLGSVSNITITGGSANQVLLTNGSGNLSWANAIGGYYLHTQGSASATWTIIHNLNNQYVSVNPIDSTGNSYIGRYDYPVVNYTNANAVTLTFSSAVTGYCAIVGGGFTFANATPTPTPGGLNTYVQFNDAGTLNGQPSLTFNKTTGTLAATFFSGDGSLLTNINASNATTAGTVTTAAQPNITSVGTLTSLIVSGSLTTTQITTGSAATPGTITGNWALTSGSRLESTYADLAEYYSADKHYPAGTILAFGGDLEVTVAGIETNKVAGVVSADPAYVMNGMIQCEHPVTIALQGRVPCKVKGKIYKGDMLISAGGGYAKAAITEPKMGTVIGKALQDFDGEEGVIEVVVGRL